MREILFCSYLEPDLVERIRQVSPEVGVQYHPDLIPRPRYEADHVGHPLQRSAVQTKMWLELMARAEILFDFDHTDIENMKTHAKKVRWIQASSAGIGQFVKRHELDCMPVTFTTAAGVHARPLAEFVLWGMLTFVKNYPLARAQQRQHHWQRFHNDDLEGKTLAIVGLGSIGREVARSAKHFGMRVLATKRTVSGVSPDSVGVDALYPTTELHAMLAQSDVVVLIAPHTPETENMIDAAAFNATKRGALLINIGRGALVEEAALLEALDTGRLGGAVLDVAAVEPLPVDHPLWDLDNVFVFPHSASTSKNENSRLTQLFTDNLRRYLAGKPLKNVFEPERMY
ncbi:D-2-hydroxyacid dehydrogenase [soil metagenome]